MEKRAVGEDRRKVGGGRGKNQELRRVPEGDSRLLGRRREKRLLDMQDQLGEAMAAVDQFDGGCR